MPPPSPSSCPFPIPHSHSAIPSPCRASPSPIISPQPCCSVLLNLASFIVAKAKCHAMAKTRSANYSLLFVPLHVWVRVRVRVCVESAAKDATPRLRDSRDTATRSRSQIKCNRSPTSSLGVSSCRYLLYLLVPLLLILTFPINDYELLESIQIHQLIDLYIHKIYNVCFYLWKSVENLKVEQISYLVDKNETVSLASDIKNLSKSKQI